MTNIPKGKEITDAITKHMDRRFLSSLDLIGQGKVTLTIDRVEKLETLVYRNGNKDKDALLIYFAETEKPLKLNVCNTKAIVQVTKSVKVADWKGKKIKLEVQNVKAFGGIKPAVRVVA